MAGAVAEELAAIDPDHAEEEGAGGSCVVDYDGDANDLDGVAGRSRDSYRWLCPAAPAHGGSAQHSQVASYENVFKTLFDHVFSCRT